MIPAGTMTDHITVRICVMVNRHPCRSKLVFDEETFRRTALELDLKEVEVWIGQIKDRSLPLVQILDVVPLEIREEFAQEYLDLVTAVNLFNP